MGAKKEWPGLVHIDWVWLRFTNGTDKQTPIYTSKALLLRKDNSKLKIKTSNVRMNVVSKIAHNEKYYLENYNYLFRSGN